jgi:hypothetical protein
MGEHEAAVPRGDLISKNLAVEACRALIAMGLQGPRSSTWSTHRQTSRRWLLNRRRAQWSDTSRHELTSPNGGEIEIREFF